jgi:hypothetical protein
MYRAWTIPMTRMASWKDSCAHIDTNTLMSRLAASWADLKVDYSNRIFPNVSILNLWEVTQVNRHSFIIKEILWEHISPSHNEEIIKTRKKLICVSQEKLVFPFGSIVTSQLRFNHNFVGSYFI